MEEKLKNISKKISDLVSVTDLQSIYDKIIMLSKKQKEYFQIFSGVDIIKLSIYVFSYKKSKKFDYADSIISELYFFELINTEGENFVKRCENCDGDGHVNCDECGGSSYVDCSNCYGSGEIDCEECDGKGTTDDEGTECTVCSGTGEEECYDCEGEGTISCDECGGDGVVTCDECNGNGEIDTDEIIYNVYDYCYWGRKTYNTLEMSFELGRPAFDESLFLDINKKSLRLASYYYNSTETLPQEDKTYCSYVSRSSEKVKNVLGDTVLIQLVDVENYLESLQ